MKRFEWVIVILLAICLAAWAFWPKDVGAQVTVNVNGVESAVFSLSSEAEQPISGYNGYSFTLHISGGTAWVEDSTCPDLICQHHAPISRSGEQIICLPGRMIVSVTAENKEVDAIAQ